MPIQPRSAKVRRRGLLVPVARCRLRTRSWWLLVILPCGRRWSAATQRRRRLCRWERRAAGLPLSCAALAIGETHERNVEGSQRLRWAHRAWAGAWTGMAVLHDDPASDRGGLLQDVGRSVAGVSHPGTRGPVGSPGRRLARAIKRQISSAKSHPSPQAAIRSGCFRNRLWTSTGSWRTPEVCSVPCGAL